MSIRSVREIEAQVAADNMTTSTKPRHNQKDINNIRDDFKLVLQAFLDRLLDKVERQVKWNAKNRSRAVTEVVLLRYMDVTEWIDVDQMKTNIKPMTFFTGFWNSDNQTFNFETFNECNITSMVFEKAVEILEESGYTLTDISDIQVSRKKVCKISWGETE
jgi:hypothetical protein